MKNKAISYPYVGWMGLFVVAPILIITLYAFTTDDGGFTLSNFQDMAQYTSAFGRSFLLAAIATVVCLLIGYPLAYLLARESGWLHRMANMLIMLPMWMNFLLRTYSVPYMFGILGIIYNPTMVDEGEDMETWDVLWNEKYAGDILMFDNSRDTIGISLKRLGYSYNTTDSAQIEEAVDQLIAQKPLLQAYVMDDIFEKLEGENAAIGVYYYGDYLTMKENNDVLAFALPREGTNRYVDAMCIPKGAENKENAEKFINFMCSTAAGLKNCEETWYSTPLLSVREECDTFSCLPAEIRTLYNDQWVRLMNAS